MNRQEVAKVIDYTLLKPEAKQTQIQALCEDALELEVLAVCVSPTFVEYAKSIVGDSILVATVCGFPSGKHQSSIKAMEAALAVQQGADEVDMVIDVGQALSDNWSIVESDIATVRMAVPDAILKVIIESALLSDVQIEKTCSAAKSAGADFVKTSTGFHPAGGASISAVKRMREVVGDSIGVKASGGIKSPEFALELIKAGASRLGLSDARSVLDAL